MIISVNWLKKFVDINMPIKELVALIGSRLVEIEEVIDLSEKYKGVVVVKVIEAKPIEGSDHLNLTRIDDNGIAADVERDNEGYIQVVCGAPNIATGQLVAWLPPNTVVPSTYDQTDPFMLGSRKLQGFMSHGMIASASELDLFDDHTGILVLDSDIRPGTEFAKAYELDDYLLDIENKSLTHRPDCFGIIGFAREVAAITGQSFHTPDWLLNLSPDFGNDDVKLSVRIDNSELSARYQAVVVTGADGATKSPLLNQTYLARVGMRPISAVVDATNYLMMLTGQPLHAFDYDKLIEVSGGTAEIHVRSGKEGEILELLDGKTIELSEDDIVIAAGDIAVALAGAMGGANTEIDDNTKNIVIECATFDLYSLRGTQMRHGIFSEAITRFTKGQPAELTAPVLFDAVRLIGEWSGAKQLSGLVEDYPVKQPDVVLNVSSFDINRLLGTDFSVDIIAGTLRDAEFEVVVTGDMMKITAPYWRSDIHILEDIVEEVGRLNGYDNINCTLPMRDFTAVAVSDYDKFRQTIRELLSRAGLNEVLTYSFIHGDVLRKAGQDAGNSYRIVNSISPNLQYYRQSLTPSLLETIHPNIKQGFDNFGVFEINKTHARSFGVDIDKVPLEVDNLAVVVTNKLIQSGAAYYKAKAVLEYLLESLGVSIEYLAATGASENTVIAPFERYHSASISGLGFVGEYKNAVKRGFKLPESSAGFELDLRKLFELHQNRTQNYKPISRYPSSERDTTFVVDTDVAYDVILAAMDTAIEALDLETSITPLDIYSPDGSDKKNITVRVRYTSHSRTLTSDETNRLNQQVIDAVKLSTNATVL